MKIRHLLMAVAIAAIPLTAAYANGLFQYPLVGGSQVCSTSVTGSTNASCVPAGPSVLTGNETFPADTNLTQGQNPQTVIVSTNTMAAYRRAASTVTDTQSGTDSPNYNNSSMFLVTLGGTSSSRTMAFPSNMQQGAGFNFVLTQGGGGSNTVTWATGYQWAGGTAPTLTTTAAHYDVITCVAISTTAASCTSSLDVHH